MAPKKQKAEEIERAVQERLPHLRLADFSTYEAKGLPSTWFCELHECVFRSNASYLLRPGVLGCPDCLEAKAREKRRKRFFDPDLNEHLEIIIRELGVAYARIYRLRCDGARLEDIGAELGLSDKSVYQRIERMKTILRKHA